MSITTKYLCVSCETELNYSNKTTCPVCHIEICSSCAKKHWSLCEYCYQYLNPSFLKKYKAFNYLFIAIPIIMLILPAPLPLIIGMIRNSSLIVNYILLLLFFELILLIIRSQYKKRISKAVNLPSDFMKPDKIETIDKRKAMTPKISKETGSSGIGEKKSDGSLKSSPEPALLTMNQETLHQPSHLITEHVPQQEISPVLTNKEPDFITIIDPDSPQAVSSAASPDRSPSVTDNEPTERLKLTNIVAYPEGDAIRLSMEITQQEINLGETKTVQYQDPFTNIMHSLKFKVPQGCHHGMILNISEERPTKQDGTPRNLFIQFVVKQ